VARILQEGDVADVEEVEAAIGEDDLLTGGAPRGGADFEVVEGEDFLLRVELNFRHEGGEQLVAVDGDGADLADDNAGGDVGELDGGFDIEAAGGSESESRDDGVAGAGDIKDLAGLRGSDEARAGAEDGDALFAEGGGEVGEVQLGGELFAGEEERFEIAGGMAGGEGKLGEIGTDGGGSAVAAEIALLGIHEDRDAFFAGG
jgi:hypothetical protein